MAYSATLKALGSLGMSPLKAAGYATGILGGGAMSKGFRMGMTGVGVGAGLVGAAGVYSAFKFEQSVARSAETNQMARLILTAQSGPYGRGAQRLGIGSNHNNTAGMSLAAHYANNRNKKFGLLGLKYL